MKVASEAKERREIDWIDYWVRLWNTLNAKR